MNNKSLAFATLLIGALGTLVLSDFADERPPDRTATVPRPDLLLGPALVANVTTPTTAFLRIDNVKNANGDEVNGKLTNKTQLTVNVSFIQSSANPDEREGRIEVFANRSKVKTTSDDPYTVTNPRGSKAISVDLSSFANLGSPVAITAIWIPKDGDGKDQKSSKLSNAVNVTIDTAGPEAIGARIVGESDAAVLVIQFSDRDYDLKETTVIPENFDITLRGGSGDLAEGRNFRIDRNTIRVVLGQLKTGNYDVVVKKEVTDIAGNNAGSPPTAGRDITLHFSSYPQAEVGRHVEFPEFIPRKKRNPDELFNPGDKVETRVVRLYYFRNAHHVAQIINRNVRQYNKAGVDRKRSEADNARDQAESATDDRRAAERAAIAAARETRKAERELDRAQASLNIERTKLRNAEEIRSRRQQEKDELTDPGKEVAAAKTEYDETKGPVIMAENALKMANDDLAALVNPTKPELDAELLKVKNAQKELAARQKDRDNARTVLQQAQQYKRACSSSRFFVASLSFICAASADFRFCR